MVRELKKEADIDRGYYDKLVNDAIETISEHGDFEWFVSDDPYIVSSKRETEAPPWLMPCGDEKHQNCFECSHFTDKDYHMDCKLGYDISDVVMSQAMNPPVEN
jgi:hypothetical protein